MFEVAEERESEVWVVFGAVEDSEKAGLIDFGEIEIEAEVVIIHVVFGV